MSGFDEPELTPVRIPAVWTSWNTTSAFLMCGATEVGTVWMLGGRWYWSIRDDQKGLASSLAAAKRAVIARLKEAACQK